MIDVGMGYGDLLQREIVPTKDFDDGLDLIAGIDDDGFARDFVTDNGAVALERADGKDLVNHRS
jgi:hypothetical protein